jgi:pyruvate ferredoxin oxidoreductase delta subunit
LSKLKHWKEIPIGGMVIEPGSSVEFDVSAWRTFRPVIDKNKCTKCGLLDILPRWSER